MSAIRSIYIIIKKLKNIKTEYFGRSNAKILKIKTVIIKKHTTLTLYKFTQTLES